MKPKPKAVVCVRSRGGWSTLRDQRNQSTLPTKQDMEAFYRGSEAHARGATLKDNPLTGVDDHLAFMWMGGWCSADTKPSDLAHRTGRLQLKRESRVR